MIFSAWALTFIFSVNNSQVFTNYKFQNQMEGPMPLLVYWSLSIYDVKTANSRHSDTDRHHPLSNTKIQQAQELYTSSLDMHHK